MTGLNERDKNILGSVIQEYIETGEPVGSRVVSRKYMPAISPATVRNTMADLEEMGFLYQPHVSAGRIPTPEGFRLYLAEIIRMKKLNSSHKSMINNHLACPSANLTEKLREASALLSDISSAAAIVILPRMDLFYFRRLEFLRLDGNRVLVILISQSGMVYNHIIYGESVSQDDLQKYANYLNETFAGLTIEEMRDCLMNELSTDKARFDGLVKKALSLGIMALECVHDTPDMVVDGKESVFRSPELTNMDRLREVVAAFEDKSRMVRILNKMLDVPGVKVLLGDDVSQLGMNDFSIIASGYSRRGTPVGSLGVIGPLRMDYARVIPLVEYMSKVLSNLLEEA